jgi:hypothetical protein
MRKVGAYALVGALAVAFSPSPGLAYGLRLGPFQLGLPFIGHPGGTGHRHRAALDSHIPSRNALYDKASLGGAEPTQGANPALLYPNLALSSIYDDVFWPARSSQWAFGYDPIFRTAFVKSPQDQDAQACQQPGRASGVVGRIRAEVTPNAEQMPLLHKLGEALGMASGYLTKSCPPQIPAQPVARLELMQAQLQALTMALDIVRPPLQQFEQSLTVSQRARFAAAPSGSGASACEATPAATGWSIDEINQTVQTTDDQRDALTDLRKAFTDAAGDLQAHCPKSLPATPLARLEATEARFDASWRAVLAMQVALGKFESRLSDEQRSRFEATDVAAAH